MNRLDELEAKLRDEAKGWTASPDVEAALLAALPRKRPVPIRSVVATAAILAIAAALLLTFWPKPAPTRLNSTPQIARATQPVSITPVQTTAVRPRRKSRPKTAKEPEFEFIRIPYTAPLEANERAEIVRVELPVAALTATGLHIQTADASAKAQADLIVGEDGMARAIRLISIQNNY